MGLCWWSTDSLVELGLARPPYEVLKTGRAPFLASVHLVPPYLLQCPTSVYIRCLTHQGFQLGLKDQIREEAGQGRGMGGSDHGLTLTAVPASLAQGFPGSLLPTVGTQGTSTTLSV